MWGPLDAAIKDLNSREGARSTHVAEGGILGTSFVGSMQGSVRKVEGREESRSDHEAVKLERPYLKSVAGGKQGH